MHFGRFFSQKLLEGFVVFFGPAPFGLIALNTVVAGLRIGIYPQNGTVHIVNPVGFARVAQRSHDHAFIAGFDGFVFSDGFIDEHAQSKFTAPLGTDFPQDLAFHRQIAAGGFGPE